MSATQTATPKREGADKRMTSRLFLLDLGGGRVLSLNPDGSDKKVIATDCHWPDGMAVDLRARHVYWTNMGNPSSNDGSIERVDLDGSNRTTIVPLGATFTPKQLHLDKHNDKLYWCDREGMRVMRANLDGSAIETLGGQQWWRPAPGSRCDEVVRRHYRSILYGDQIYWTQKGPDDAGQGTHLSREHRNPEGRSAAKRSDIEVLFDNLPEPIDIELDLANRLIYWTDRGDPPRGNTVNCAPMDADFSKHPDAADSVHPFDGRNRDRAGFQG